MLTDQKDLETLEEDPLALPLHLPGEAGPGSGQLGHLVPLSQGLRGQGQEHHPLLCCPHHVPEGLCEGAARGGGAPGQGGGLLDERQGARVTSAGWGAGQEVLEVVVLEAGRAGILSA